jgi:hypothetical protein
MNTIPVDFSQIEFNANRALAYVILASESLNNYVVLIYRLNEAASELKKFLPYLTPEYLESLTDQRKRRLTVRLKDAHRLLVRLSRSREAETFLQFPVLCGLVNRVREKTQDLAFVLDDLVFAGDPT